MKRKVNAAALPPATVLKDVVTVTSDYTRTWDRALKTDWYEPLDGEDDAPWVVATKDGAFTWVSSDSIVEGTLVS